MTDVRALSAKFVQKPQDKSADAVLEVVLLPSYVLYSAATVNSVTEFFKTPEEEEQLDFTGLTAAAASQLERARRMAAEYAAAALSNKPRLKMKLDLEAPKISIPVQDAEGEVSVALDLGRFIIESDAKTAASLPSEEAGLYECIRLSGRNVSVYVVDGMFDWAELSTEADVSVNLVPVLQRCKLEVGVQAARYPDPKFPRLRLFPTIPMLHFHISPGRLSRMLRVMHAVVSAPSSPAVTSPSALPSSSPEEQRRSREAWRLHADCQGPLKLLTWTGIGRSTASWVSRYSLLYRGKMYIYKEGKETEKATEVITTWPDRVVLRVPPEHVRGANNVLAVRPSGPAAQDMAHVMEDSDTWLLRLGSESEASKWYRQLLATQHRLDEEVQGQGQSPLEIDWDASSVSTSLADESEEAKPPGATQGQATGDHPAVVPSPPVLIELDAQLGECAIFASGREPGQFYWPPPTEAQSVEDSRLATRLAEKNGSNERGESSEWDSKQLDNEICLVIVRATQGSLGIKYGDFGMTIHTSLGSFEIRDMLLGKRSPSKCFLACSSIIGEGAMAVEDEIFFDPVEADQSVPESQTPRTPRTPLGRQPSGKQDLAEFTFALRRPGFPEYQGTDSTLDIKLNRLYFFCNRPTVAALISMGMDLGVAMSKGFGQSQDSQGSEETSADKLGQAESIASAADQGAMQTTSSSAPSETEFDGEGSISDVLAREDGERTMFALNLSLEMVQVVFNYEGYEDVALVSAGINNFTFKLATAPDGAMYITSSLGNLVAEDCTLEQNHPYRQACGLRAGRSVSLVEVGFDFHPRGHYDERVPKGMEFYSLRARLSELQLVFLYRLVQQVTQYLVTMLAMRLPEDKGVSLSTGQQPAQSTEGTGARPEEPINEHAKQQQPMLLVMDIEMDAPIITVPASSDSLDALDVDLGILHLRTSVIQNAGQEQGEGEKETGLFEKATLTFSGVGCSVIQAGVGGHSIIKNPEQGWKVQWQRSLDAENRGNQPFVSLFIAFVSVSKYAV